jgi:hypothetical protein
MTQKELTEIKGKSLTVNEALSMAYKAGGSHILGSHIKLKQNHLESKDVIPALCACVERTITDVIENRFMRVHKEASTI